MRSMTGAANAIDPYRACLNHPGSCRRLRPGRFTRMVG